MNARDARLMWLQECPGLGPARLERILARFRGTLPDSFFGQPPAYYRETFRAPEALSVALAEHTATVPADLRALSALPLRAITVWHPAWPPRFQRLKLHPALIWAHGSVDLALTKGKVSVLCSAREELGRAETVKPAYRAAVEAGWTIVAGHNRPVYQWGLLAAKRAGAPSIMVLDRGLLAAFDEDLRRDPVPAARIWGYGFDVEHSVALSPFRLRDPWIGHNGRGRDALVAALSDVIVAIGVQEGGTMHRLCVEALGRGQTVLAEGESLDLLAEHGAHPWEGCLSTPDRRPENGPEPAQNG